MISYPPTQSYKGRRQRRKPLNRAAALGAGEALLDRSSDSRNSLERSSRARARTPASGSAAEAAAEAAAPRGLQDGSRGHLVGLHLCIVFGMPFLFDFGSILPPNLAPQTLQNRSKIDAQIASLFASVF